MKRTNECMKRPLADMKRSLAANNTPHEEQKLYCFFSYPIGQA